MVAGGFDLASGKGFEEGRGKENVEHVINESNKDNEVDGHFNSVGLHLRDLVGGTVKTDGGLQDVVAREFSKTVGAVLGERCVNVVPLLRQKKKDVGLLDVDLKGEVGGRTAMQVEGAVVTDSKHSSSLISV
ncbi:hypothetical protein ACOSQ3_025565 [Xanthoceras sorbifolium]